MADQDTETRDDTGGSLAEHEAAHPFGALTTPLEPPPAEEVGDEPAEGEPPADPRDDQGRFKPRHRARSQQASAEDVETIAALTKRIKEAEAADGTDIVQRAGESNRVFELRRRAELAERRKTAAVPAARVVPTPPRPAPAPTPVTPPKPTLEAFAEKPYEEYLEALTDWKADRAVEKWRAEHQAHQARETAEAEQQRIATTWAGRVKTASVKYPDFARVALEAQTPIPAGSATDVFILEDESGADVLYYLHQHPDELSAILQESPLTQVKRLTLLAQRLTTPTTEPAVTTGAAARAVSPPAPRPVTPVRTGPMRTADEPPDPETSSLSDHERFYHKQKR